MTDRLEAFIPQGAGHNSVYAQTLAEAAEALRATQPSAGRRGAESMTDIVARMNTEIFRGGEHTALLQKAVRELVAERMKAVRLQQKLEAVQKVIEGWA